MSAVLDLQRLELELARVLEEPEHARPAMTLVVIQFREPGPQDDARGAIPDLAASLATVAGARLRRADTVAVLDERTLAALLVGASPPAAEAVAGELVRLLQPLLPSWPGASERSLAHGIAAATGATDTASLIAAARADMQRRVSGRREATTR